MRYLIKKAVNNNSLQLEENGALIIPLDTKRQNYRYHPLLATFLTHQLQTESPARNSQIT